MSRKDLETGTWMNSYNSLLDNTKCKFLTTEDMERDMIIMRHEVHYKKVTDSKQEVREIVFIAYGDEDKCGFSAMAKTVGLTIGYAAKLLLNGKKI